MFSDMSSGYRAQCHRPEIVLELVHPEATYWFTDGSYTGHQQIGSALAKTWDTITNETYRILDIRWIASYGNLASCTYRFEWSGTIDGVQRNRIRQGHKRASTPKRPVARSTRTPQRIMRLRG